MVKSIAEIKKENKGLYDKMRVFMCREQKYTGKKGQLKELSPEDYCLKTPVRVYFVEIMECYRFNGRIANSGIRKASVRTKTLVIVLCPQVIKSKFCDALADIMEEKGLSVKEMAHLSGYSLNKMCDIVSGRVEPDEITKKRLIECCSRQQNKFS